MRRYYQIVGVFFFFNYSAMDIGLFNFISLQEI